VGPTQLGLAVLWQLLVYAGLPKAFYYCCPQNPFRTAPQHSISMYRTSDRPATLDFFFPPTPSTIFGTHLRKDIGLQSLRQLTPPYFEASLRDGLRTPPADDMTTTYQHAQYNEYAGRQDATYSMSGSSGSGYTGAYSAVTNMQAASHSALRHPPAVMASTLHHEIQAPLTSHHAPSPSPQPANKTNALAAGDNIPSRKSSTSDTITPNLQIPPSINNGGGSLAEFAAQVIAAGITSVTYC
jgi:hypothetical protein